MPPKAQNCSQWIPHDSHEVPTSLIINVTLRSLKNWIWHYTIWPLWTRVLWAFWPASPAPWVGCPWPNIPQHPQHFEASEHCEPQGLLHDHQTPDRSFGCATPPGRSKYPRRRSLEWNRNSSSRSSRHLVWSPHPAAPAVHPVPFWSTHPRDFAPSRGDHLHLALTQRRRNRHHLQLPALNRHAAPPSQALLKSSR